MNRFGLFFVLLLIISFGIINPRKVEAVECRDGILYDYKIVGTRNECAGGYQTRQVENCRQEGTKTYTACVQYGTRSENRCVSGWYTVQEQECKTAFYKGCVQWGERYKCSSCRLWRRGRCVLSIPDYCQECLQEGWVSYSYDCKPVTVNKCNLFQWTTWDECTKWETRTEPNWVCSGYRDEQYCPSGAEYPVNVYNWVSTGQSCQPPPTPAPTSPPRPTSPPQPTATPTPAGPRVGAPPYINCSGYYGEQFCFDNENKYITWCSPNCTSEGRICKQVTEGGKTCEEMTCKKVEDCSSDWYKIWGPTGKSTTALCGVGVEEKGIGGMVIGCVNSACTYSCFNKDQTPDTGGYSGGAVVVPPPPPPTPTPIPRVEVSGTVYDDPLGSGGGLNKCTGLGTPFKPGGGSKVTVNPDGRDGPVQGNGNYVVNQVMETGAKTIAISGMDSGYQCTCPGGCQYTGATVSGGNNTGWNFYVSNILSKWAQVAGGHVHGQTGATVEVPAGNYFLIKGSFTNEPGAGTKVTGNFNVSPGQLSTTGWNLTDALTQTTWRYAYQRLWVRAGSPSTDPGDGSSPPAAGIYRKSGGYTISGGGWQGMAGSRVIFVDGDVNINSKVTLAGTGDFFAVIASGNISVDPAVGDAAVASPTPGNADLVGAFLANGDFNGGTTASQSDKQLVIYGTVGADIDLNGSGRVRFQRDMGVNNRVGPGVAVIWNPNLLLNFPSQLTDALTDWREVAP